jgi:hypothetical protein
MVQLAGAEVHRFGTTSADGMICSKAATDWTADGKSEGRGPFLRGGHERWTLPSAEYSKCLRVSLNFTEMVSVRMIGWLARQKERFITKKVV